MPAERRTSATSKHAIVTGAASGLGRAIAVRLARDGWHIALVDINDEQCEETLRLVRAAGGDGQVEHLDITDRQAWAALRRKLECAWPQLDLLVNNAGITGAGEIGDFPLDEWHRVLSIDLFGVIYGCHTMIGWLKRNPRGASIINTSSSAAIVQLPVLGAYNVAKAGVVALSETLAAEVLKDNVCVTVLCPAFFPTNLLKSARIPSAEIRRNAASLMRESKLTADDVAEAAVRAMYRKRLYVVLPWKDRILWRLKRLLPESFVRYTGWKYAGKTRTQANPDV